MVQCKLKKRGLAPVYAHPMEANNYVGNKFIHLMFHIFQKQNVFNKQSSRYIFRNDIYI